MWRIAQAFVWAIGADIVLSLLFCPSIGVLLFWNILIPVAPALFVVGAGIWRNVCPLATVNLLPRHLGWSKRKKLTLKQMGIFNLIGVIALLAIVPLRHALFNTNGLATALLILSIAVVSILTGFFYEWKSAWCSGLCPIHPVEKLYGENVLITVPNAHCDKCMNCVVPCPDSTPNINPTSTANTIYNKIGAWLIVGGLPGFIWGWFHVADESKLNGIGAFLSVYKMPMAGFLVTPGIYAIVSIIILPIYKRRLTGFFAALSVSCYYWYRIPALLGFGNLGTDGLLIDLKNVLPEWIIPVITLASSLFFFYWLVVRERNKKSWLLRPLFAHKQGTVRQKLYS